MDKSTDFENFRREMQALMDLTRTSMNLLSRYQLRSLQGEYALENNPSSEIMNINNIINENSRLNQDVYPTEEPCDYFYLVNIFLFIVFILWIMLARSAIVTRYFVRKRDNEIESYAIEFEQIKRLSLLLNNTIEEADHSIGPNTVSAVGLEPIHLNDDLNQHLENININKRNKNDSNKVASKNSNDVLKTSCQNVAGGIPISEIPTSSNISIQQEKSRKSSHIDRREKVTDSKNNKDNNTADDVTRPDPNVKQEIVKSKTIEKKPEVVNNDNVQNVIKNNMEAKTTTKNKESHVKNVEVSDIIEESATLPSEKKTSNSTNSGIVTAIKTADQHTVEKHSSEENRKTTEKGPTNGLKTEDVANSEDESSSSAITDIEKLENIKNTIEANVTKKIDENKNDDTNKQDEGDAEESQEQAATLPSVSKSDKSPKSEIVTVVEASDYHPKKVIQIKHQEKKKTIEKGSENGLKTEDFADSESSPSAIEDSEEVKKIRKNIKADATKKIGENKNDDYSKEDEGDVEESQEAATILSSESKSGNSPKSENVIVMETSDHPDKVIQAESQEKKETIEKDPIDDLINKNLEDSGSSSSTIIEMEQVKSTMETNATNKIGENKNDDSNKEDEGDAEESQEEVTTLCSESKVGNSPKSENIIVIETPKVIREENEEKKELIEKDSKNSLINEDLENRESSSSTVIDSEVENIKKVTDAPAAKEISENKNDDNNKQDKVQIEKSQEEAAILYSESKSSTENKEKKETIEKDSEDNLISEDLEDSGSSCSTVIDTQEVKNLKSAMDANTTKKISEDDDNKEHESDVKESQEEVATLSSDNSPKLEIVTVIETSDPHPDKVIQAENQEKKETIEKDSKSYSVSEDLEDSGSSSSTVIDVEEMKNLKKAMEANATKEISENKNDDSNEEHEGDVEKSQEEVTTLSSENKSGNSPKSKNVIVIETSDHHPTEVIETENEEREETIEKESKHGLISENLKDSSLSMLNIEEVKDLKNTIESESKKNSENKTDDSNKEEEGDAEKSQEEVTTLASDSKSGNSPKSENVTEVIETENEEEKETIEKDSKYGIINEDLENSEEGFLKTPELLEVKNVIDNDVEANGTKKSSDNIEDDVENAKVIDIIEESATLPSVSKTSNSPIAENVADIETSDQQATEIVKSEDENKKIMEKDSLSGVSNTEYMETEIDNNAEASTTEKLCENKNDDDKGDEDDENKPKVLADVIEISATVPPDSEASSSPKSQTVTTTETPNQETDKVVKTDAEEKTEIMEKDSKSEVISEDLKDSESSSSIVVDHEDVEHVIDNMETNVSEKCSENKKDVEQPKSVDITEEFVKLVSESEVSNSSKLENVASTETSDCYTDENIKAEDESIEKDSKNDIIDEEPTETESSSLAVASNEDVKILTDNDIEENSTEKSDENKSDSDKNDQIDVENAKEANIIGETDPMPSDSTIDDSSKLKNKTVVETPDPEEDTIVKCERKEEKLESGTKVVEEASETNKATAESEEDKEMQSQHSEDGLNKEPTEYVVDHWLNLVDSCNEEECNTEAGNEPIINTDKPLTFPCESKIGDSDDSQNETKIKSSHCEEDKIVTTENEGEEIQIKDEVVEEAAEAIYLTETETSGEYLEEGYTGASSETDPDSGDEIATSSSIDTPDRSANININSDSCSSENRPKLQNQTSAEKKRQNKRKSKKRKSKSKRK